MKTRAIECPSCGGSVELRGYSHSLSAVCIQCLSVIDTSSPELKILKQFQDQNRVRPLVPLGSRGRSLDLLLTNTTSRELWLLLNCFGSGDLK